MLSNCATSPRSSALRRQSSTRPTRSLRAGTALPKSRGAGGHASPGGYDEPQPCPDPGQQTDCAVMHSVAQRAHQSVASAANRHDLAAGVPDQLPSGRPHGVRRTHKAAAGANCDDAPTCCKDPHAWMLTPRHGHHSRGLVAMGGQLLEGLLAGTAKPCRGDTHDQARQPEQHDDRDLLAHVRQRTPRSHRRTWCRSASWPRPEVVRKGGRVRSICAALLRPSASWSGGSGSIACDRSFLDVAVVYLSYVQLAASAAVGGVVPRAFARSCGVHR